MNIEKIGDLVIIECAGRIVRSDDALELRQAVISQDRVRTVVLELTEVKAIDGWGMGILAYLQQWARTHNVRLKLFNPSRPLLDRLNKSASMAEFEIATLDEMMALLGRYDARYAPPAA